MPANSQLIPGLSTLKLSVSACDAINAAADDQQEAIIALSNGHYHIASLFIQEAITGLQRAQAEIALAAINKS